MGPQTTGAETYFGFINETETVAIAGADRCTAITNGTSRTALAYDGLGRWSRIQEYSGASLTADRRFVWNGTSPAEERDSTGTTVVKRFYANGFWQTGTNYYYLTDHLGSIREVTLANGTVVARFEYDPYGRRTQTFGTLWVDFGFAGLFELPNGLKLAVWRMYDPNTGRWNSRDPIGEEGGWNLYAYCENNSIVAIDHTGLNRTLYMSGIPFHFWISVDVYDSKGAVIGQEILNYAPETMTDDPQAVYDARAGSNREVANSSFELMFFSPEPTKWLPIVVEQQTSSKAEDEALVAFWLKARHSKTSPHYDLKHALVNNCNTISTKYFDVGLQPTTKKTFWDVLSGISGIKLSR